MDTNIEISLRTWLILLYFAIGLSISILKDEDIPDSGKRTLRSWGITTLWAIYVPISISRFIKSKSAQHRLHLTGRILPRF